MRTRTLAAAGLLAAAALPTAAQAAAPRSATFLASMYGVQRYGVDTVERQAPGDQCYDHRGTTSEASTLKFTTTRPVKVVATVSRRGTLSIHAPKPAGAIWDFTIRGAYQASGHQSTEIFDCVSDGAAHWALEPEPLDPPCSKNLTGLGMEFSRARPGRLAVRGGWDLGALDPFGNCQYGDRSGDVYSASAAFPAAAVLDPRRRELKAVLRGGSTNRDDTGGKAVAVTTKRTTVYVTLKRLTPKKPRR